MGDLAEHVARSALRRHPAAVVPEGCVRSLRRWPR
jgi:hypothetical protein